MNKTRICILIYLPIIFSLYKQWFYLVFVLENVRVHKIVYCCLCKKQNWLSKSWNRSCFGTELGKVGYYLNKVDKPHAKRRVTFQSRNPVVVPECYIKQTEVYKTLKLQRTRTLLKPFPWNLPLSFDVYYPMILIEHHQFCFMINCVPCLTNNYLIM